MKQVLGLLTWVSLVLCQGPTSNSTDVTTTQASQTSSAPSTTTSVDVSVEDLWNFFVGPVSVATVNTTVEATPVPSSELIPPPPLQYPAFPTGHQYPAYGKKNTSWCFPKGFFWGVASAAINVEGAVKDEGRGPSIWDVLSHRVTNYVANNDTGDIADNHYYLYKQDIARIAALGTQVYSFSISWSRIMPFGRGAVNEQALAHYDDVINTCLQYNVTPAVTLYHWDLPLFLQNLYGGWLSENIVADFLEYARVVFSRYGNRVGYWITLSEPGLFCYNYPLPANYFKASMIPPRQQPFYCGQNALLAHSQAYRLGKSMNLTGPILIKHFGANKAPLTNSTADAEAVQRDWDFGEGWYAGPIFNGDYPAALKAYTSTFLRDFTDTEKAAIKGSSDIFGMDAYTSYFVMAPDGGIEACLAEASSELYPSCANHTYTYPANDGGWNIGYAADPSCPWLHSAADWVPAYMRYIYDTWKPPSIAITELGFADPFEAMKQVKADILTDLSRRVYFREYLQGILLAISEGVPISGVLAWSLVDTLEWRPHHHQAQGYKARFGLQYVNFSSPMLERSYKASFFEYANYFKTYLET